MMSIVFTAYQLEFVLHDRGARDLDDRQAEALAVFVNSLQEKIDDLGDERDERDELLERIEYMEQHPPGHCRCRECYIG